MNIPTGRILIPIILLGVLSSTALADGARFVFGVHSSPKPVPAIEFNTADGIPKTLDDFAGKYVLLNVWATWCPPCRKELPDLAALEAIRGGDDFQVIALSTDAGRLANVVRLYEELGLETSEIFIDETGSAMRKLGIFALPTTLLINPEGQEIGRKPGPADWDSVEALEFFDAQINGAHEP